MRFGPMIFFFYAVASCQTIEDGWRDIKPLKTQRSTLDRLFGPPKPVSPGYFNYNSDEACLHVTYATKPCMQDDLGRGEYNVPKDTVLSYYLRIKKDIKLTDLKFKRDMYKKDTSGDVPNVFELRHLGDEIIIDVYVQEGVEYVSAIRIGPSKKDTDKFKCDK